MADIELVIRIPRETYEYIKKYQNVSGWKANTVVNAINNGTPLPKEYGRLIDVDEVVKEICIEYKANSIYELSDELRSFIKKYLNEATTILKPTIEYMIKNYAFSKSEE